MSEILRRQYESTFSSPDTEVNIENLDLEDFFKLFDEVAEDKEEAEQEGEPTAKEDSEIENLPNKDEEEERKGNKNIEEQMLTDVPCDYMDIADAIDQLETSSGPGPDGISAILLKKSKITG